MISLKRNIVVNYLGQTWAAVMGFAFIPLYIKCIGVEAYGLIGLFAVMQAWITLLDMGMTPTLNREMARFTAGAHSAQTIRNLLHSVELICFSLAILIAITVWGISGWLAHYWFKAGSLPVETIARSLSVMAFVIALRFVEGIYRGSLFGLQKQVWYNGISAILATLRYGGSALIVAYVSPTLTAFFLWQALVSLLTIFIFEKSVMRSLPPSPTRPAFSVDVLAGIWKFAWGMMWISLLSLILTQVDKIILSKLISLEAFGYYTLAASLASLIYMIIGPITLAIYPHMVELQAKNEQSTLASVYHQGAQLVTVLTAPIVLLLWFCPEGIVFMWSGNIYLAENTARILSVLGLGTFLNGLMWVPYQLQLAHGWTGLTLKSNLVAVITLIPAMLLIIPRYGALGAAWIWVLLNTGYIILTIQFMHFKLLPREKWHWYFGDVFLPIAGPILVFILLRNFQPLDYQSRWHWFFYLLVTSGLTMASSVALADRIRDKVITMMSRYHSKTA